MNRRTHPVAEAATGSSWRVETEQLKDLNSIPVWQAASDLVEDGMGV
jgi:hypothetical protein